MMQEGCQHQEYQDNQHRDTNGKLEVLARNHMLTLEILTSLLRKKVHIIHMQRVHQLGQGRIALRSQLIIIQLQVGINLVLQHVEHVDT